MIASMSQRGGQAPRRSTLAYEGGPGTVYLLHFARPFGPNPSTRTQHYLGWTQNLRRRLNERRKGRGSGVTPRAHREGVPFVLAQTWPGTTQREAELRCACSARASYARSARRSTRAGSCRCTR